MLKKIGNGNVLRVCAWLAALVMVLTLLPAAMPAAEAAGKTYGKLTTGSVALRKSASTSSEKLAVLSQGWVMEKLGTTTAGGETWVRITGRVPGGDGKTYTGYIYSKYFKEISLAEAEAWLEAKFGIPSSATAVPPAVEYSQWAKTSGDKVNLREQPSTASASLATINSANVFTVINVPEKNTADYWYFVEFNGIYGYVNASYVKRLTVQEAAEMDLGGSVVVTTPTPTAQIVTVAPTASAPGGNYIHFTHGNVAFRATPGISGTKLASIPMGTTIPYYSKTQKIDGYYWYYCTYEGKLGYVAASMVEVVNEGSNTPVPVITQVPTAVPTVQPGSYTKCVKLKTGLYFRETPGGKVLGSLKAGTIVPVYGYDSSNQWVYVYSSAYGYGYVSSNTGYVEFIDAVITPVPTKVPTAVPQVTATPTPVPTSAPVTVYGYVAISASAVNVRKQPGVKSTVATTARQNNVLKLVGSPVGDMDGANFLWYPVQTADGTLGYVRDDVAYQLSAWQEEQYLNTGKLCTPTPGPTAAPVGYSSYVKIKVSKCNVRSAASTTSTALGTALSGEVYAFSGTRDVGSYTWYRIQFKSNSEAWVRADMVKRLTWDEYNEWEKGHTTPVPVPTAAPAPTATPAGTIDFENLSDLGLTLCNNANIREDASTSSASLGKVLYKSSTVTWLGKTQTDAGNPKLTWFYIQHGAQTGWMRSDVLRMLTTREKSAYTQTGNPDLPPEASYTTLSLGSSGEAVRALQKELYNQGYLNESDITGSYMSATVTAVENYQRSHKLTVDGIAGPETQHSLFNTVPEGTYNSSTADPNLQPVEKADWYKVVDSFWRAGETAIVTDVKTGLSFRARRWAGSQHADVEPLTAADTAVMCHIYGVSDAQEILEKNLYQRRPMWVTLNGRTFASSMYGVPHNYPEGDTIPDNNFSGQFCLHFVNSKTHGSAASPSHVDSDHQKMIQYAYDNSISGQK